MSDDEKSHLMYPRGTCLISTHDPCLMSLWGVKIDQKQRSWVQIQKFASGLVWSVVKSSEARSKKPSRKIVKGHCS